MHSLVVPCVMVAAGLASSPAIADEAGDRVDLMARIDDEVHAIATAVEKPSATMFEDAAAHGRDMRRLLEQLVPLKGNNKRAADMLAHYPRYAEAVDTALAHLKLLTAEAVRADGVAERCEKDDAALEAEIRRRSAHPDADPTHDADALAGKGAALGAKWRTILTDLASTNTKVAADLAAARLGLTDGYWMAIATNVGTVAQTNATSWTASYEATTTACEQLGRGVDHASLGPVLVELRKRSANRLSAATQIVRDYNAWLASVRDLRALALKNRELAREAACTATDTAIVNGLPSLGSTWARELAESTTNATAEMNRIKAHANDNTSKARAVLDGLRINGAIVAAVARGEALGHDNPKLRALLGEMRQRRDRAMTGAACATRSIDLAASDCGGTACRVECMKLVEGTCTVIEPAPEGDVPKADAFAHGGRDLSALRTWYTRDKASLFARVPIARRCEAADRGSIELFADVATYPACTLVSPASLGESLAEVTADLAP